MIRIYERKDGRFVPVGYSCLTDHVIRYDDEVQAIQEEMKDPSGWTRSYALIPIALAFHEEKEFFEAMRIQGYGKPGYRPEQVRTWIMERIREYIARGKEIQGKESPMVEVIKETMKAGGPLAGAASIMLEMERETPGIIAGPDRDPGEHPDEYGPVGDIRGNEEPAIFEIPNGDGGSCPDYVRDPIRDLDPVNLCASCRSYLGISKSDIKAGEFRSCELNRGWVQ